MLRIYSIFMFMMMTITVYAQESSANAKNLKKEGLQKMALFTLTKEEAQYTEGKARFSEAKAMYNSLLLKADKGDVYSTIYLRGVESVESLETLYDQRFKESIQLDQEEAKVKVKFDGKEYKVSKNQKSKYELVEISLKPLLK